jgi:hypothetical protein
MIDVHDCDVRLPSSGDSKDLYIDELVRLSVIGGRVVKTIYRHVLFFFLVAPQSDVLPALPASRSSPTRCC